jgi:hypothetical protein
MLRTYLWYTLHVWDPITDEQWEVPLPYTLAIFLLRGALFRRRHLQPPRLPWKAFVIVLVYCADFTNMLGVLWQGFSMCFSTDFYRSPAKPLTKKRLPS